MAKGPNLGTDKHPDEAAHSHAPYGSAEDLEARLAAARGDTPDPPPPLPPPDPGGRV